eukprot:jgi/Botrbrau1/22474/Bobra.114_2s0004.1
MTSMFTLLGEKRVRSTTPPPGDAAIAVDGALSGPIQEALKNILPTIITESSARLKRLLEPFKSFTPMKSTGFCRDRRAWSANGKLPMPFYIMSTKSHGTR